MIFRTADYKWPGERRPNIRFPFPGPQIEQPLESLCPQLVRESVKCADVLQSETPLVQQGLALFQSLPEPVQFHEDSKTRKNSKSF